MSDVPELEPVDIKQCQTEKQEYSPFRIGGSPHTSIRCESKPMFVVTEIKPDKNGQTGAMSLCPAHLLIFQEQMPNHATAYVKQTIDRWKSDQEKGLVKVG